MKLVIRAESGLWVGWAATKCTPDGCFASPHQADEQGTCTRSPTRYRPRTPSHHAINSTNATLKSISPPDCSRLFQKANARLRNDRGCCEMSSTVGADRRMARAAGRRDEIRVSSWGYVCWEPCDGYR